MTCTDVDVLVLNFNGAPLLARCLPSVVWAAARSRHRVRVHVIDNGSSDHSLALLQSAFPAVRVWQQPNRGLCSYNEVATQCVAPLLVLLNNDIRLAPGAIDPLIEPLLPAVQEKPCPYFFAAPLCWQFDGQTYDGQKTAVRWRWGLVQATSLFAGHDQAWSRADETASAGAALAVVRSRFLQLGGFDPRYLPGRLEDLDLAYRAWQAGYQGRYVPQSVAFHLGQASFLPAFGAAECDALALRNTLLFQWKNLRHPRHLARQGMGLALRGLWDIARAPWIGRHRRWQFWRALIGAVRQARRHRDQVMPRGTTARELAWFQRFHPQVLRSAGGQVA